MVQEEVKLIDNEECHENSNDNIKEEICMINKDNLIKIGSDSEENTDI